MLRYKDLREDNDLLQKDVAKILNVTAHTYGEWERGTNDMALANCVKLANFYNTSIDYLLGRTMKNKKISSDYEIDWEVVKERLLIYRKKYKLSQTELGNKVGLPQGTYSNYEIGRFKPTTLKLMNIADFYNISMDYLVGRCDEKELEKNSLDK